MSANGPKLVWMDLEMTGLDPKSCAVVQMAIIITDTELNQLADPLDIVIWQPDSVLETMGPFVRDMHTKTGLLEKIRSSSIALEDAERAGLELITRHAPFKTARLCGNSIGQDRRFLYEHMPALENYLHYRQIDVSTLKEIAGWWFEARFEKADVEGEK
ncbi:MAG: oligoribonuclease, partial [Myxococcota bacterium]